MRSSRSLEGGSLDLDCCLEIGFSPAAPGVDSGFSPALNPDFTGPAFVRSLGGPGGEGRCLVVNDANRVPARRLAEASTDEGVVHVIKSLAGVFTPRPHVRHAVALEHERTSQHFRRVQGGKRASSR